MKINGQNVSFFLERLNHNVEDKTSILVIGSVSLFLQGIKTNRVTEDIDAMILDTKNMYYEDIWKVTKNDGVIMHVINSNTYDLLHEVLYKFKLTDIILIKQKEYINLKIYVPKIKIIVTMKLIAMTDNPKREKDWIDITSRDLLLKLSKREVNDVKRIFEHWNETTIAIANISKDDFYRNYYDWVDEWDLANKNN